MKRSPSSPPQAARRGLFLFLFAAYVVGAGSACAQVTERKPKADEPSLHAYPALGMTAERKVAVEWNRFYDHAGLGAILAKLNQAFPKLTKLYSIGKSYGGRDLWCLEVTAPTNGVAERKPGIWIDGNIHGNEVQAGEAVAYTAWYLCHQYGQLGKVTELLDQRVFYLTPTINPDGRDQWFHSAQTPHSSRTGIKPHDDDGDGLFDEDDYDDLDGDGSITQMRIKDPNGRWKPHPQYPDYLMVEVAPEEKGEYTLLGYEGIDNDGDGLINEDPVGGYDMNRNWAWDWQPNYVQNGSHDYPFSLPETRAVADFVTAHPNIAALQTYHNAGGMILRPPGREGGNMRGRDDQVFRQLASRGEKMLPFYRSMVVWKDLYTTWGSEFDWSYSARGILSFCNEIWSLRSLENSTNAPSGDDEASFVKYLLLSDGVTKWHEFQHPTYGKIEIGGYRKQWSRTPPSFLLEAECHRNMAYTLFHADQMPLLNIDEVRMEKLDEHLFKVRVTVRNARFIPTRLEQDVANKISHPDFVTLSGPNVKVISSGFVTDPYFNQVQPVKRHPERIEVDSVPGTDAVRVEFIAAGSGGFTVTVDSEKGGVHTTPATLP